jgi:DNA-binding CsgD family transcriptional regulator
MMHVPMQRMQQLLRLFGEAYELTDREAIQLHLLGGFLHIIGGIGIMRVQLYDYAPNGGVDIRHVVDVGFDDSYRRRVRDQYVESARRDPAIERFMGDDFCQEGLNVIRRTDVIDNDTWYSSPYVTELRRPARIDDCIYTGRLLQDQRGDGLGVFRAWGDPSFTEEDRELTRLFHVEVLSRFALPQHGLEVVRLSPRERQMLAALLSGQRRKEIAADLGLSLNTVDTYVRSLYQRLGVSGLPELYERYGTRRVDYAMKGPSK